MQKALTQMNVMLHTVVSDLTGATGLKVVRSILAGERDPEVLTAHRDSRNWVVEQVPDGIISLVKVRRKLRV